MAITNFIPELWSANILLELQKNLVYGSAVNRDYEGDIANYGDTVHITGIAHISIGDYTAHTDITIEPATDKDAGELVINQSKYFAFEIDDVEKRQAMNNLTAAYSQDAAYKLRDLTDQYLAGLMAAGAKSKLDPISGATATKAYATLVDWPPHWTSRTCPTRAVGSSSPRTSTVCCARTAVSSRAPSPLIPRCSTAWSVRPRA